MKIIIIGAGVSGLSTYLFLKKHLPPCLQGAEHVNVQIYEAYDVNKLDAAAQSFPVSDPNEPLFTPAAIGNAIGIQHNGLKVLSRLDEDGSILKHVLRRGNPIDRWRMSNARGWTLADFDTVPKSAREDVSDAAEMAPTNIMIARQHLWEVLRDEVLKDQDAIVKKRVSNIQIREKGSTNIIEFEDGTADQADLIIGADGLRSIVRCAMFEAKEPRGLKHQTENPGLLARLWAFGTSSSPVTDYITPQYEGLVGVGDFIPTSELQQDKTFDPKTMNIVFGPNGFFGYGCISSAPSLTGKPDSSSCDSSSESDNATVGPVSAWWSTFSSPTPYPYQQAQSDPSTTPTSQAIENLLSRHARWNNPTIHRILSHTTSKSPPTKTPSSLPTQIQVYPTWTTPELPTYHLNGTCVLVGDAAHALQPSSGQGASLALEDAETLALLLKHHLQPSHPPTILPVAPDTPSPPSLTPSPPIPLSTSLSQALSRALSQYTSLRRPRIHAIHAHSQKMSRMKSDMGLVAEMLMYLFIWLASKVSDGGLQEKVLEYDVPREVAGVVERGMEDGG